MERRERERERLEDKRLRDIERAEDEKRRKDDLATLRREREEEKAEEKRTREAASKEVSDIKMSLGSIGLAVNQSVSQAFMSPEFSAMLGHVVSAVLATPRQEPLLQEENATRTGGQAEHRDASSSLTQTA